MLYEIGNAMHTTLNLEEILYIILTAVTSHAGLSFNRAMLFLVKKNENRLEGKMGIGPDSGEEANTIWSHIERHKMGFEELIETHSKFEHLKKSKLNRIVKSIKIPIEEQSGIIAITAKEGVPFIVNTEEKKREAKNELLTLLDLDEFVTVPLKARDRVIGVILADNRFTKKAITENDVRMLTMFANQAGLAIENSRLYERTVVLSNSDSLTGLWHHGYFQYLLGFSPSKAGFAMLISAIPIIFMAPVGGMLMDKYTLKVPTIIGLFLTLFSFIWFIVFFQKGSIIWLLPSLLTLGWGLTFSLTPALAAGITSVPNKTRGMATGIFGTLRNAGRSIGFAVVGAIILNVEHIFFSKDLEKSTLTRDRKSTRLNSSHIPLSRMPSSA